MDAIPTTYNGVNFRSRLEAKWAAFFDLLGWRWQYEPIDLDGWIPDFMLLGAIPTLVEVKPITDEDVTIEAKMVLAAGSRREDLLLVGIAPFPERAAPEGHLALGWISEQSELDPRHSGFSVAVIARFGCKDLWRDSRFMGHERGREGTLGFCSSTMNYVDRISGEHTGNVGSCGLSPTLGAVKLWKAASNSVQWNPPTGGRRAA
jgi:hypothetical protein